jgi:hypothetical protein
VVSHLTTEVRLDYNPLCKLAGLLDPDEVVSNKEIAKVDLVQRMQHSSSNVSSSVGLAGDTTGFMEEAEEGDYGDDEVFVPWGESLPAEGEAAEGSYSDDEVLEGRPKAAPAENEASLDDDVPPFRPSFPVTKEQMKIGPYVLAIGSPAVEIPASINRFLRVYQREGVEFLYRKYQAGTGGILGDDMG